MYTLLEQLMSSNQNGFPSYNLARGPHDPSNLQHRHQWSRKPAPVLETVPSMTSHKPGAAMTRISQTTMRRRNTNQGGE